MDPEFPGEYGAMEPFVLPFVASFGFSGTGVVALKVCSKCGSKYFGGEVFCSLDGEPLLDETGSVAASPDQVSAVPSDPFLGQRIEKYDIVSRLGEGGMGEVYEAKHVHIGKRVALKVLREDFSKKEEVVERFRQEARSASIIGHENIIDITDFGTTPDGRFFFVMEYLDGEDLASVFEKTRTIPYERALRILKQVCAGLVAAHDKGIIHRDLKPENIYLVAAGEPNEQVKILDFGIAKMSVLDGEGRKLTKTGVVFGTPEYMSPEQAGGKPVDARIDVYAIGVIMFEMFTGMVPFTGDTFMSILTKHMFEPVPDMHMLNSSLSIPDAMESIVNKALAKERDERFDSMGDLLTALEAVERDPATVPFEPMEGQPRDHSMETPGPVLEVVGDVGDEEIQPKRGRGLVAALIAIIVLALLGGGVVFGLPLFTNIDVLAMAGLVTPAEESTPPGEADEGPLIDDDEAMDDEVEDEQGIDDEVAVVEPEVVNVVLEIRTDPEGATVEVDGKGEMCDSTPCELTVLKDEQMKLIIRHGKVTKTDTVTASADPTVVKYSMKPRKPGKGTKKGNGDPEDKPGKKGSIDMGELKIPSIYKKNE